MIVGVNKKNELLKVFQDGYTANLNANMAGIDLLSLCKKGDSNAVKQVCEKVKSNILAAIPEGYAIPKALMYVTCTGTSADSVSVISISVSSSWKSDHKFKFSIQIPADDAVQTRLIDFLTGAYDQLFYDELIMNNVDIVNNLLKELTEAAGLSFSMKMVSPMGMNGKKVAAISNDEIVFVADFENIFQIDDILAFQEISEEDDGLITAEQVENAKKILSDELGVIQTTVQMAAAHGGSLVKILSNIGTSTKAMTLIRKVTSKNVEKLTGASDTHAYYEKDGVYAIVARSNGVFQVVLSPFDVETLEPSDVDVLTELSK